MATVILTQGLPAAGKSTVIEREFSGSLVVSPDAIKETHPDYDRNHPEPLHLWSKEVAEVQWTQALEAGPETHPVIVYDGTSSHIPGTAARIRSAKAAGYRVVLVRVEVSLETSIERNRIRGIEGRSLSEKVIREIAADLAKATEVLSALVDEVRVIDNEN